jgi:hypothetical protein
MIEPTGSAGHAETCGHREDHPSQLTPPQLSAGGDDQLRGAMRAEPF